jgi:hypothetical protein
LLAFQPFLSAVVGVPAGFGIPDFVGVPAVCAGIIDVAGIPVLSVIL